MAFALIYLRLYPWSKNSHSPQWLAYYWSRTAVRRVYSYLHCSTGRLSNSIFSSNLWMTVLVGPNLTEGLELISDCQFLVSSEVFGTSCRSSIPCGSFHPAHCILIRSPLLQSQPWHRFSYSQLQLALSVAAEALALPNHYSFGRACSHSYWWNWLNFPF